MREWGIKTLRPSPFKRIQQLHNKGDVAEENVKRSHGRESDWGCRGKTAWVAVSKSQREQKQQRPQLGVPHIIGLIYIRNTAQGMSMIICRGLRANRAEGRKKQPEESLRKRDPFRPEPSASTRTQRRSSGVLPPTLGRRYGRFEIRWEGDYSEPQHRQTVVGCGQTQK